MLTQTSIQISIIDYNSIILYHIFFMKSFANLIIFIYVCIVMLVIHLKIQNAMPVKFV